MIKESGSNPEVPRYRRELVVDAFRIFPTRGFTTPDDLPLGDQDVINANALLQVWANQQEAKVRKAGTLEADLQYALDRSTIHFDAGFTDTFYLDEVANDWLSQDLQRAEKAGLTNIATRTRNKIDEINAKLPPN